MPTAGGPKILGKENLIAIYKVGILLTEILKNLSVSLANKIMKVTFNS